MLALQISAKLWIRSVPRASLSSSASMEEKKRKHFLLVSFPIQSHINPARYLARRLARATGAAVTVSAPVSAHRRMFPGSDSDREVEDGLITYVPFSDGCDEGYKPGSNDAKNYMSQIRINGSHNISNLIATLADRGRPVTCVIYTLLLTWVADVALEHGITSVLYWIQPASVFAACYHFFHGYESYVSAHAGEPSFTISLPGLQPMQIRDLPSFIVKAGEDAVNAWTLSAFRELFETLDREGSEEQPVRVLINTFDALEADALASITQLDTIAIGPLLPFLFEKNGVSGSEDLFKIDGKNYMEWLDGKPEGSVVYVSFGSMAVMKKKQMEEMLKGLKESKRPYLWVVRKDNRGEWVELEEEGEEGMVVEWCSQVKVLRHPAVGCFVTHCGWNSTLESLVCGVPMVGLPQWTDQVTNAKLVEAAWGTGVRGKGNEEGVLEGDELRRSLEMVMGEEGDGVEMRRRARMWRDKAAEAVMKGGSSDRNLKAFVEEI